MQLSAKNISLYAVTSQNTKLLSSSSSFLLNTLFVSLYQSEGKQFHNLAPEAEKDLSFPPNLNSLM